MIATVLCGIPLEEISLKIWIETRKNKSQIEEGIALSRSDANNTSIETRAV